MDCAKLTYANLDICTVEKQYIYMHILDTTYWYLDLVSITYFVYIVHTVHIYICIYICTYIYMHIYMHIYICIHVGQETIPPATIGLAAEKTPLPCHRGGGTIWLWGGRGVGVPAHIYTSIYLYILICIHIHIHIDIYLLICTHTHIYIYITYLWLLVYTSFQPKTNYK